MAAAAAAAIAASQMMRGGENHQTAVKIKIVRQNFPHCHTRMLALKRQHTGAANAGLVPQVRRHLREQFFRDLRLYAPAQAFEGGGRTDLALVRPAAQRTPARIMEIREVHGKSARTR
jgi:hypothetical protein